MKILLLNPNVLDPPVFPVGLEYTAEHLVNEGWDCSVLDMNVSRDLSRVPGHDLLLIAVRNLDSGVANSVFELQRTREVIREIRKYHSGRIAVAGSGVNLVPEATRAYLGVDHALASKGFGAVDKLLAMLSAGEEPPPVIRDFSQYVNGRFRRNVMDKAFYLGKGDKIGVATKFGCPFSCQYCDYPGVDGHHVVQRPTEEVVAEVASLREQGIKSIFFCDAVFNIPVKSANKLLRAMLEAGMTDVDWDGFINPHKAAFTREFAELLPLFGRKLVYFGVDSLCDPVLLELRKGFTVADVRRAVAVCHELGMEVACSLLFGHPCETPETVAETFRTLDTIPFKDVDVTPRVRLYPEAPLFEIAKAQGIVREESDLLEPVMYPSAPGVFDTIVRHAAARPHCHMDNLDRYRVEISAA